MNRIDACALAVLAFQNSIAFSSFRSPFLGWGARQQLWMSHWGFNARPVCLNLDSSPCLHAQPHDEAIACLVFAIETGQRRAILAAPAGLGKTAVLRQALAQARGPRRRFASVSCPYDGTLLFALLAGAALGQRVVREPVRLAALAGA